MEKPRHTPGPWEATTTPAGKGKVVDRIGASICNTTAGAYKTQTANARLIAAAPDLLEALEELHDRVAGECGCSLYRDESDADFNLDQRIRAAIAKAKGVG